MRARRRLRGLGWLVGALAAVAPPAVAAPGLVSPETLAALRQAAAAGDAAAAADVSRLLEDARRPWRWGSVSGRFVTSGPASAKRCHPEGDEEASRHLLEGASDAYAQALGAHLDGDAALLAEARRHVLDLVDTHGFHGLDGDWSGSNQCILELALSIPVWIETARLLEGAAVWSGSDAAAFRSWLASRVHPRVAWASRARSNNWGAAGSLAAWAIATYVTGHVDRLEEPEPDGLRLAPAAAAADHAERQRRRIAGEGSAPDARCAPRGMRAHGGIPEELRRGATGCDGRFLVADDASLTYQTMHVELLVLHAELMRRSGDPSLYRLELAPGVPAILQAIRFVIDNPFPDGRSWPWPDARRSTLIVAATFYDDRALDAAATGGAFFRAGRTLPYARVTHGHLADELPADADPDPDTPLGAPGRPEVIVGFR